MNRTDMLMYVKKYTDLIGYIDISYVANHKGIWKKYT